VVPAACTVRRREVSITVMASFSVVEVTGRLRSPRSRTAGSAETLPGQLLQPVRDSHTTRTATGCLAAKGVIPEPWSASVGGSRQKPARNAAVWRVHHTFPLTTVVEEGQA